MIYKASRFWGGWKSWTKFFIPDRIEILNDRIVIKKRRWFGLTGTDEEISFSRIASVRLVKGVFTGSVLIETMGGAVRDMEIRAFNKKTAHKVIKLIKEEEVKIK